ncbi:MAG: DUF2577 domain-containing protein [Muribaculaceae bacterium]|nr:DUF2577 domain-containing protein [Muribaculaceae bacterium]
MSSLGRTIDTMRNQAKKVQPSPVQVGQVLTLHPLSIQYQGLELSFANGDTIYINNLLLDENINLDVASMDSPQTLDPKPWIANNSPNSDYTISGTQKQFLTDFYNWTKAVHNRFILHIGDYVAVQRLGNNTYLILEKISKVEQ